MLSTCQYQGLINNAKKSASAANERTEIKRLMDIFELEFSHEAGTMTSVPQVATGTLTCSTTVNSGFDPQMFLLRNAEDERDPDGSEDSASALLVSRSLLGPMEIEVSTEEMTQFLEKSKKVDYRGLFKEMPQCHKIAKKLRSKLIPDANSSD